MLPGLPIYDCATTKPCPFHVIRLELADASRVFGSWTGARWIAAGDSVAPVRWQELTDLTDAKVTALQEQTRAHADLGGAVVLLADGRDGSVGGSTGNGSAATDTIGSKPREMGEMHPRYSWPPPKRDLPSTLDA